MIDWIEMTTTESSKLKDRERYLISYHNYDEKGVGIGWYDEENKLFMDVEFDMCVSLEDVDAYVLPIPYKK